MRRQKTRRQIPAALADDVLFLTDHTCCICRTKGKDVHLHHIDGKSSNNTPDNLATVCLDCHSKVTGGRGLGRIHGPGEVRRYKRSWEKQVLDTRLVHRPAIRYKKELISQIDLIVCDVLARRRDSARVKELLDLLWEIHLWRGGPEVDDKIVEGLSHLAVMSGLSSSSLASMVAEKLWEMCFHFVGPKDVPMDSQDERFVLKCLDALSTLASFNCEFGHGGRATEKIAEQLQHFFEVGLWYSRRRIANAVLKAYGGALKACESAGASPFGYGRRTLRHSLRALRRLLEEQSGNWQHQRRRVGELLTP